MAKYSTRQRDILLSYLEAHADEQMSIQKIASDLEEQKVSSSAVYRNLFDLEKENGFFDMADSLVETLGLDETNELNLIISKILQEDLTDSVIFLTGVGK